MLVKAFRCDVPCSWLVNLFKAPGISPPYFNHLVAQRCSGCFVVVVVFFPLFFLVNVSLSPKIDDLYAGPHLFFIWTTRETDTFDLLPLMKWHLYRQAVASVAETILSLSPLCSGTAVILHSLPPLARYHHGSQTNRCLYLEWQWWHSECQWWRCDTTLTDFLFPFLCAPGKRCFITPLQFGLYIFAASSSSAMD